MPKVDAQESNGKRGQRQLTTIDIHRFLPFLYADSLAVMRLFVERPIQSQR